MPTMDRTNLKMDFYYSHTLKTELWPLIDVRFVFGILFPLNILRMKISIEFDRILYVH